MKIILSVTFLHCALIFSLFYLEPQKMQKKSHAPITVKTYMQKVIEPAAKSDAMVMKIEKPAPSPKKKTAEKKPSKKIAKGANSNSNQKLISLMQESLNQLNHTASKREQTKVLGKQIKLASENLLSETNYEEELIVYLESQLTLPENGEIKLKLTLTREGSLQKMDIVSATCEQNRKYVESALNFCSFPPFGLHFKGEKTHTFTITLTSENYH